MNIKERLYNPSKPLRFKALKEMIKNDGASCIPDLKKFIFLEKDKDLLYYARKSLHILTSNIKKEINTIDFSDHKFIQILYSSDTPAKLDIIQKAIKLNKTKYKNCIKDALKVEKDPFVIATLIKAVGQFGDFSDSNVIIDFLDHPDSRIRSNSIECLSNLGKEDALPFILPKLEDENPRVRVSAANYLITYSDDTKIDNIIQNMTESRSVSERAAVLFLIDKIRAPRYSSYLMRLIKDKNEMISKKASEILEKINNLISNSEVDEFEMLKKIKQNKKPEVLEEDKKSEKKDTFYSLINELTNTQNPDIQKKCIINLERLGDLRAINTLENIDSDSKVVNYFKQRALDKLNYLKRHILVCPNCGFQIRKENENVK